MIKKDITFYECEICQCYYTTENNALECEKYPLLTDYKIDDFVIYKDEKYKIIGVQNYYNNLRHLQLIHMKTVDENEYYAGLSGEEVLELEKIGV